MALKYFRPKTSDRSGIQIVTTRTGVIGTHGTNIGNSGTTTFSLGAMHRRCWIERINYTQGAAAAASASALTCIVYKEDNTGTPTAVALNSAASILSLNTDSSTKITITATLTDAQRTMQEGDTLYVTFTAAGTVSTQPTDGFITVELLVLE